MSEKLPRLYRVKIGSTVIVLAHSAEEAESYMSEQIAELDDAFTWAEVKAERVSRQGLSELELARKPYIAADDITPKSATTSTWLTEIEGEEKEMKAEVEFQKKQIPLPFNRYRGLAVEEILEARGWNDESHIKLLEGFLYSRELYGEFRRYLIARAYEEELDSVHEEELG
jgi:hypothetical protein